MSGNEFSDWYKSIPKITRAWFTGSIVIPLAVRFGILNARWLILDFQLFFGKFQVQIESKITE
jgi:derlin-1